MRRKVLKEAPLGKSATDFSSKDRFRPVGDYGFWVERIGGKVLAFRQGLRGNRLDLADRPETVRRDELPDSLQGQYDMLMRGDLPAVA